MKTNLILIGMPGAGKSTVGVVLAKAVGKLFIDTDLLIQQSQQRLLSQIIQEDGVAAFLALEERVVLQIRTTEAVIATGGSVVYSPQAMEWLKTSGWVIYLQLPYAEIERRVTDMIGRGIVRGAGQQLSDLYRERIPLYEKYADITIDCNGLSLETVVAAIIDEVNQAGSNK
ncbi:MAG TPA: shikimate kinase [Bacillota bacterium]